MLEEADVGICAHANGAPGFDGILRHRFSDFKVNEIATDMTVARLTCLKEPEALVKPAAKVPFTAEGITECVAAFRAVAEERHAAQLQTFLQTALDKVRASQRPARRSALDITVLPLWPRFSLNLTLHYTLRAEDCPSRGGKGR